MALEEFVVGLVKEEADRNQEDGIKQGLCGVNTARNEARQQEQERLREKFNNFFDIRQIPVEKSEVVHLYQDLRKELFQ